MALVGFMGAGKSTVGRLVAQAVGLHFVDLDREIVRQAEGVEIPALFAAEGEAGFRAREARALAGVCAGPPVVLALGGGTMHQPGALERVRAAFVPVVLDVPWAVLAQRLAGDTGRPLAGQAARLFAQRAPGYAAAGERVDADAPPDVVAGRVIEVWRRACASM